MDNGRNHKFVQPNVWGWMLDSQSTYSSYHLEGKVIFEGVRSVTAWVTEEWCCVMSKVVVGRRGKKVLVAVAEGRRTTEVEDGIAVGLGYGIPESREFFKTTP
ncbi:hypothetical protein Tco_0744698 [Tanacetum coccineum]